MALLHNLKLGQQLKNQVQVEDGPDIIGAELDEAIELLENGKF